MHNAEFVHRAFFSFFHLDLQLVFSVCAAGYEGTWIAGGGACVACTAGTFKPAPGSDHCYPCPSHLDSTTTAATVCGM